MLTKGQFGRDGEILAAFSLYSAYASPQTLSVPLLRSNLMPAQPVEHANHPGAA